MGQSKEAPTKYLRGTNEYLDVMLEEGDEVWIVNRSKGRRPILAGSAEEALEKYENA